MTITICLPFLLSQLASTFVTGYLDTIYGFALFCLLAITLAFGQFGLHFTTIPTSTVANSILHCPASVHCNCLCSNVFTVMVKPQNSEPQMMKLATIKEELWHWKFKLCVLLESLVIVYRVAVCYPVCIRLKCLGVLYCCNDLTNHSFILTTIG